jgi:hypothetical protein
MTAAGIGETGDPGCLRYADLSDPECPTAAWSSMRKRSVSRAGICFGGNESAHKRALADRLPHRASR